MSIKTIELYECTRCGRVYGELILECPQCCSSDTALYLEKFPLGCCVRTTKGDRFNPKAREEKLVVVKHLGLSQLGYRISCRKPNGKTTPFLAKNLREWEKP